MTNFARMQVLLLACTRLGTRTPVLGMTAVTWLQRFKQFLKTVILRRSLKPLMQPFLVPE